jgi:hypothetical protein
MPSSECYDKLADYLLECCHAEAKPNTLSLFSFLPLFVLSLTVQGPSHLAFLFTALCLLGHQLLDIANKKQAYRLKQFSLATFLIDHLCDALSVCCIVFVVSRLLELSPPACLTAVFFFGMLPFYLHHLAMYCNEYMTFWKVAPTTEGTPPFTQASSSPNSSSSSPPSSLSSSPQKSRGVSSSTTCTWVSRCSG